MTDDDSPSAAIAIDTNNKTIEKILNKSRVVGKVTAKVKKRNHKQNEKFTKKRFKHGIRATTIIKSNAVYGWSQHVSGSSMFYVGCDDLLIVILCPNQSIYLSF